MRVDGVPYRAIWPGEDGHAVKIIDQTVLPHRFEIMTLTSPEAAATAIRDMHVRGAPLIGATAAYGLALAARRDPSDAHLAQMRDMLGATRPTAVNLHWALDVMMGVLQDLPEAERADAAYARAGVLCDDDVEICRKIGEHGLPIIREIAARKPGEPVNILTHCNAGWIATVDWGTALAPIYMAHDAGIPVHVWVDETRPRNQGAALTAWELGSHGVPHTVITDNAGGHVMRLGQVDICITGTDRVAASGDVANKIGTYLKALAARDNGVPFYVALPHTTIDWSIRDGMDIPIEMRDPEEVTHVQGLDSDGALRKVQVSAPASPAANHAFDVTPARLVTGFITERGLAPASAEGLAGLYPEQVSAA